MNRKHISLLLMPIGCKFIENHYAGDHTDNTKILWSDWRTKHTHTNLSDFILNDRLLTGPKIRNVIKLQSTSYFE